MSSAGSVVKTKKEGLTLSTAPNLLILRHITAGYRSRLSIMSSAGLVAKTKNEGLTPIDTAADAAWLRLGGLAAFAEQYSLGVMVVAIASIGVGPQWRQPP